MDHKKLIKQIEERRQKAQIEANKDMAGASYEYNELHNTLTQAINEKYELIDKLLEEISEAEQQLHNIRQSRLAARRNNLLHL
jgi:uncharacterized protein YoxC